MIFDYPLIRWVKGLGIQYNLVVIVFCVDWDWLCELENRFKFKLETVSLFCKGKTKFVKNAEFNQFSSKKSVWFKSENYRFAL